MLQHFSRWLLGLVAACALLSAQADMSQTPLLTQSGAVEPNLVFVFDDSGSMAVGQMYQFGSKSDSYGMVNPETGGSVSSYPGTSTSNGVVAGSYAHVSPDLNLMAYDPRVLYKLRVNADGTNMVAATVSPAAGSNTTTFNVYFYRPSITTLRVSSVTVNSGGKKYPNPSGTMTMTFSAPPAGGVRAEGTVTVATSSSSNSRKITAITVTKAGSGYTTTPTITLNGNSSGGSGFKYTVNTQTDVIVETNQKWDGTGTVSSLSDYFSTGTPAGYTPDVGSPLATGATSISYPNTASKSVANYPKFAARTDCTGNTCTWAQELQNYLNWKLYHSSRVELARTGIGLAFQPLGATFRLGWGSINTINSNSRLDAGVNLFTTTTTTGRKQAFYDWLYGSATSPGGSTPNRLAMDRVGQYFTRSDSDGPWGTNPSYTSTSTSASTTGGTEAKTSHASCRRSNMLLMTDGYWNGGSSSLGNIDGTDGPVITSASGSTYQYKAGYPYKDITSDTLADVAMKYWVNDLRTDLPNNVASVAGINESFWQNVSFYGIGLGIYGTLPQTPAMLSSLSTGDTLWPVAKADTATAIDDMWHAAVNSRGQFLSAGDSDALTASIQKMMVSINKLSSSQSGVAVSTANLVDGTRKYTPQYTTGSWAGNVTARNLDPLTANEISTAWQIESKDPLTGDEVSLIPSADTRNIVVGNGASTAPKAVPFTYAAMNAVSGLTAQMAGSLTVNADLINYLRGDASNEGEFDLYRVRETRLGDIVNSAPVFVKKGIDRQYEKLPSSTFSGVNSYRAFVTSQAAHNEGVLFVGANDGMLHAFRDGTTAAPENAGLEVFAYVPRAVLPNLSQLADKAYSHKYYVDGPVVQAPAYINSSWNNLLLGTTGAGAKAVFALNVTNPLSMNANSVLWEVSSTTTGFSNLGYIINDIQAGPLPSGDWVAIFGNGYFSTSGAASLYVVNLATGALIQEINTGATGSNGLGGVRVVRDDTQRIIGAYAGDLKGNLWKFDLSGSTSGSGVVGLSGTPLLAVGSTKPITAPPSVLVHPNGGYLVAAGTGKFFESGDTVTTNAQSLYGVWDSVPFGTTATPSGVTQTGTTNLQQQTISTGTSVTRTVVTSDLTTTTQSVTYFSVSTNPVDWTLKRGWYINLPNTGERVVYPMNLLQNTFLAVDSISPTNVSTNACIQTGQGTGWVYIINGLTGAGPGEPILDTNGDGNVDSSDALVSGFTARADGRNSWLKVGGLSDGSKTVFAGINGGDGSGTTLKFSCTLTGTCTSSSTSTVIKSREWRQLFMR